MSQKGGVFLIVLILIVGLLLFVAFLVSQNPNWFSESGNSQTTLTYPLAKTKSTQSSSSASVYQNPFSGDSSTSSNPENTSGDYQNPFDNL